jgi:hypothetical protein
MLELVALLSCPIRSRRDRAGAELYAIVRSLCARPNCPPRSVTPVLVPVRWREDIAHDVMLKLTESGEAIIGRMLARSPEAHLAAETYVRRMIAAHYLTLVRRCRTVVQLDCTRVAASVPAAETDEQSGRGRGVVEGVLTRMAASPEARRSFEDMDALAAGLMTMEECIERELAGGSPSACPEAAFRTARNRLQQRHRRLRVALLSAIEQLFREGELDAEDARAAVRFVEHVLNRAPKRNAASFSAACVAVRR